MRKQRTLWTVLGLTLAGFAVGGTVEAQESDDMELRPAVEEAYDGVTLTIRNDNFADMRIFALRLGTRYRIGTVTSFTTESFELPSHLQADISELQLLALPIGSTRGVVSPVVYPSAGDEVVWGILNNLSLSGTVVGR